MVRFGACSVDVSTRVVERDGEQRHLEPQAFDLLAYLVSNADRVVPKEELLEEVWGDQFVSESALTTRIKEIRHALGDDGTRQAVVKNFRGRGYRFVADVETGPASPDPPSDRLVGRDADIDEAAALLRTARLVTLVGPGGVGKTTLARELARRVRDRFADGVAVVPLAEVAEAASVAHLVRRSTDLIETGSDHSALVGALAGRDVLVVLDNCEHVVDTVGRLVADVLDRGGPVRFLATSRERLGVAGEQLWSVNPLDEDAARDLLLSRARLVRPGYSWGAADGPHVDRILRAVDRLPLAIEMVAARLPTMGVDELGEVLATRLDLLRSADRTAVERHRTLDALIGWSEDLLDDDERALLAAMSVFAGAVSAADIAAVTRTDVSELVVGPLAALVDKSLVVADSSRTPTCYRLLETVRARVARRRPVDVDERHARHVAEAVTAADRRVRTADEPEGRAQLDALVPEIRTAHAWARTNDPAVASEITAALLWFAHERQWTEPATWAGAMRSAPLGDDGAAIAASLAADASNRGRYEDALGLATRAAASDDPRVAGSGLDTLINIGVYTGDLEMARLHAERLSRLGIDVSDPALRTLGVVGEVLALVYGGRLADGRRVLEAFDRSAGLGPTCAAWLAYVDGELLSATERHDEAVERFDTAVRLGRSVGSRFVVGVAQVSSLAATARSGDVMAALAAFRPVLEDYRRMRSDSHGITTIRNLIEALVRAERYEPAMELLGALSRPEIKATYGVESDRLDAARATTVVAVGEEPVATWTARGAGHDLSWALDHAIDVLDTTVDLN